jgi:bacterioferritin-associated ferredoxin
MYVCLCHGLSDRDVRAAGRPNQTIADLYRMLDVVPSCGKCVPMVCEIARAKHQDPLTETGAST